MSKQKDTHKDTHKDPFSDEDAFDTMDERGDDEKGKGASIEILGLDDAEDAVEAKDDEIRELHDFIKQQQADYLNLEKRQEKSVVDAAKYANKKIIEALLPVLDGFSHALQNGEPENNPEAESIFSGLKMSSDILMKVLAQHGVSLIEPKLGDAFNPDLHEAMTMQQDPNHKKDTILAVIQPGYLLNDRVVRAARVVVNQ